MQEFYYRRVEDGTFCLTGYEGDEAEVIIPDDKVFTILSDKVFRGHDEITSIRIPDSVTGSSRHLHLRTVGICAELSAAQDSRRYMRGPSAAAIFSRKTD